MAVSLSKNTTSPLIRIAIVLLKGFIEITKNDLGELKLSGTEGYFIDAVFKSLGYRYELVISPDGEWGRFWNGNWTGMIGEVVHNRADIAWTRLSINEDRSKVVDFSPSYYEEFTTFAVTKPDPLPLAYTIFYPFDLAVWICIVLVLVIFPLVFLLGIKQSVLKLYLTVFGSFLKQPLTVPITSGKLVVLASSWLLFTTFLTSFYGSVLLSFLTKPLEPGYVKTFPDLLDAVKKGNIECRAGKSSYILSYLHNSVDENLRELAKTIKKNEWYTGDILKDSKIVTTKDTAIINTEIFFRIRNSIPGSKFLIISSDVLYTTSLAVAMRKDFCCKKEINTMIHRANQAGLYYHFLKDAVLDDFVEDEPEDENKTLIVSDVSGAFFILISGILLSILAFFMELILHKGKISCKKVHHKKNSYC